MSVIMGTIKKYGTIDLSKQNRMKFCKFNCIVTEENKPCTLKTPVLK